MVFSFAASTLKKNKDRQVHDDDMEDRKLDRT